MSDGTENITDREACERRSVVPVAPHVLTVATKNKRIEESKKTVTLGHPSVP